MKNWKECQKHHEDYNKLVKELNMLNSKGQLVKFNGAAFWPKFQSLGHSSMEFDKCSCNKQNN